ncbi:hypothetical protein ACJJTC_013432 [Scirpophaga incertulas]
MILTHGTLSWHQLQIIMSRSTTPDLLKMQLKLEEFFTQQFKSSKRVFSSLHPNYTNARRDRREPPSQAGGEPAPAPELRHHRHWQSVLRRAAALLPAASPRDIVLGGTMELHGTNISLACFHGNSFKVKSWALFSLKDPCISFATEAQHDADDQGPQPGTAVVQSLTASLGAAAGAGAGAGGAGAGPAHQSMATVCRMTRAVLFPPQLKTLREWFQYAFANSEIDAIELFPSLERPNDGAGGTAGGGGAAGAAAGGTEQRAKAGGERHVREVIFALPALQLHLRTRHRQPDPPPADTDPMPVVECSFITEFEDHIFVSVDAEAFLFLHDLISSYIKEKDRFVPNASARAAWAEGGRAAPQDFRDYHCHTWHLEPTVRLLSWAGKSIEPYGVDYILQKLGFRHARTTIPKWVQRGALDALDSVLALALLRLLRLVPAAAAAFCASPASPSASAAPHAPHATHAPHAPADPPSPTAPSAPAAPPAPCEPR